MRRILRGVIFTGWALWALLPVAAEELFEARIYQAGSDRQILLFLYRNSVREEGGRVILTHDYLLPDGTPAARETVEMAGGKFSRHTTDFFQTDEHSLMVPRGQDLEISFRKGTRSKEGRIAPEAPVVFGPTQQEFIRENFPRLSSGEPVSFFLPAPEYLRLVPFTFTRRDDSPFSREGALVLRMNAESWILRMLAGGNDFVVDARSGQILEIHGPSILPVQKNGRWTLTDVDIVFEYPREGNSGTAGG